MGFTRDEKARIKVLREALREITRDPLAPIPLRPTEEDLELIRRWATEPVPRWRRLWWSLGRLAPWKRS